MDLLSMRWEDLLFAHWDVDPEVVARRLPDGFEVDTYDGSAWLGVVPFVMRDIRPRFAPFGLDFAELNLRTYVRVDGVPGVYFFSLDADDALGVGVARLAYELPYYRAETEVEKSDGEVSFRSSRTHTGAPSAEFEATYSGVGDEFVPEKDSLAEFLTERYAFFVPLCEERMTVRGEISHPPWKLREASAEIETNTLFEANGFEEPDGDPHLLYSEGSDVTASRPRLM
jgi:uncharacterized protein YqjF (DUF2071 family)